VVQSLQAGAIRFTCRLDSADTEVQCGLKQNCIKKSCFFRKHTENYTRLSRWTTEIMLEVYHEKGKKKVSIVI